MTIDTARWTCWRDPSHEGGKNSDFGWPECKVCGAAPPYHERPNYLPADFALNVYILTEPHYFIAPGSAIVGIEKESGVLAYYEGWIYDQLPEVSVRDRWEAGVMQAADRMVTRYPTTGFGFMQSPVLKKVGTYLPRIHQLVMDDEETLKEYLNA